MRTIASRVRFMPDDPRRQPHRLHYTQLAAPSMGTAAGWECA